MSVNNFYGQPRPTYQVNFFPLPDKALKKSKSMTFSG